MLLLLFYRPPRICNLSLIFREKNESSCKLNDPHKCCGCRLKDSATAALVMIVFRGPCHTMGRRFYGLLNVELLWGHFFAGSRATTTRCRGDWSLRTRGTIINFFFKAGLDQEWVTDYIRNYLSKDHHRATGCCWHQTFTFLHTLDLFIHFLSGIE